ncbi:S8 family serine peptidase [Flavobacterium orientale]|uniref:Por secretion system C-terminal sorting domain-containing protein n=1 Tax=Flavobacterium orientale TaxID=1756020 RepID=A0A916XW30_9FLAO|nr:S8 family serine peptidase [Flavobacterium orientale]GGD14552.1 hypothetical protein GCM10011343_02030 [Flavobacterium orientale]
MRILYLFLFSCIFSYSQNKEQLEIIKSKTNQDELARLKTLFDSEHLERQARIDAYLVANPTVERRTSDGLSDKEIYDISDTGAVIYLETGNATSAITSRVSPLYSGGGLGLSLQGQGMKVGVWDSGQVRDDHVEFDSFKATNIDFTPTVSNHGTHVMGTVIANGLNPAVRGIAFNASGDSYDWSNDYSEMVSAAAGGLLVSNHSYWIGVSGFGTWLLGAYDSRASQFDQIAFNAPYYLAVTAAGNDRNDNSHAIIGPHLINKFGYDLIRGMQNAKNYLTVGAVSQVLNYVDASSVSMSSFSSWGPTDDGRIKPDVVAKGVGVNSTTSASTTSTGFLNGTSMASPSVAGVALLLQQHSFNLFTSYMRAATVKGLIMHTADEAGFYDGPDYEYGWGLVNAAKAATTLSQKVTDNAIVDELNLANNQSYSRTVVVTNNQPLMVSISWTDRPSTPNNGVVDPATIHLINDLDVRVTKNTDVYYPWTLNPALPYDGPLQNADNFRDNFEKIQVDNPSGSYTITVTHKGTLVGGSQDFTLIVTGSNVSLSANSIDEASNFAIYPNPSNGVFNVDYAFSSDSKLIEVFDVQGRIVKQFIPLDAISVIDLSSHSSGLYFVKCTDGQNSITKKVVIQ